MSEATTRAGRQQTMDEASAYIRGTNYLLAIAIDEYVTYPKLANCVKDLSDIRQELITTYDFEEDDTQLIVNDAATERNIMRALDEFYERVGEQDSFILMYSGHGENLQDRDIGCLIPVDATDKYDFVDLSAIKNRLDSFKAKHIVVIFDSCFSGLILTQRSTRNNLPENYPSRFALTSGRNSPVSDGTKGKNSPFAEAVLVKLRDNTDKLGANALAQSVLDFFVKIGTNESQLPDFGVIHNSAIYRGQYYFYPRNYEETLESQRKEINKLQEALDTIERQKEELASALQLAKSQTLAAKALVLKNTNPTVAIRVAEAGYKLYNNKETSDALKEFVTDESIGFYRKTFNLGYPVLCIAFSPDGKTFFAGTQDKTAKLWDLNGEELHSFIGHDAAVRAVVFSPDGKTILTGSDDSTAILWDVKGKPLQTFKGHQSTVRSLAYSPDGHTILSGSEDRTAILWDLKGNRLQTFQEEGGLPILSLAFSADGQSVLTASEDGVANLYDLKAKFLKTFRVTESIRSIAVFPNREGRFGTGMSILTGNVDHLAVWWDLEGSLLQEFKGHNACVYSFAFSPDGNSLLTGSEDNTAIWWDHMGNRLQDFKGHQSRVNAVAFSPNGQSILSGSDDQTVILWNLRSERLQHFKENNSYLNIPATFVNDEETQWKTIFAWLEDGSIAPLTPEQKATYGIEE